MKLAVEAPAIRWPKCRGGFNTEPERGGTIDSHVRGAGVRRVYEIKFQTSDAGGRASDLRIRRAVPSMARKRVENASQHVRPCVSRLS
jgi:hypothetical protein